MDNKRALRIKAKSLRKNLDIARISDKICFNIRNSDFYKNASNILIFYPTEYEIDLRGLLNDNKNFYLPKVNGEKLYICPYNPDDKLETSEFNIKEPCTAPVNPEILDLIFVPALSADNEKYRLGYGGGYYDRFLAEYKIFSVVPIADALLTEKLPVESHDKKVDIIITETSMK